MAVALAVWALIAVHGQAQTIASQSRTIAAQRTALAGVLAHAAGGHRDLLACSDLQQLINSDVIASWYVDCSGNLNSVQAQLPPHCVNH